MMALASARALARIAPSRAAQFSATRSALATCRPAYASRPLRSLSTPCAALAATAAPRATLASQLASGAGLISRMISRSLSTDASRLVQLREKRARMQAWNTWLTTENLYLSYTRNGIISTVAAIALVQFRVVHTDKAPFSGMVFFALGGYFFGAGSIYYLSSALALRVAMRPSLVFYPLVAVNGLAPPFLWLLFLTCFTEHTPEWLRQTFALLSLELDLPTDFKQRVLAAAATRDERRRGSESLVIKN